MTEEEREVAKANDRERKANARKKVAEKKMEISNEIKKKKIDADKWEKKKIKQLADNCKTQQNFAALKTEEENEETSRMTIVSSSKELK